MLDGTEQRLDESRVNSVCCFANINPCFYPMLFDVTGIFPSRKY
jgi:hypothetical protein